MKALKKIKFIIEWIPVLWNNAYDYDYQSALNVLRYQLQRTRKHLHKHNSIIDNEEVVLQLDTVDSLFQKVSEDPEDEWSVHWNMYHNTDDLESLDSFNKPCPAGEEAHKEASDLGALRTERNWLKLWHYIYANMRNWWD